MTDLIYTATNGREIYRHHNHWTVSTAFDHYEFSNDVTIADCRNDIASLEALAEYLGVKEEADRLAAEREADEVAARRAWAGWKSGGGGFPGREWDDLFPETQRAWLSVARALRDHFAEVGP